MTVELPKFPGPANWEPQFLDFAVQQKGGPIEAGPRFERLGNRWRCRVQLPAMRLEPMPGWGVGGRVWLSRLRGGLKQGVRFKWYQQGFKVGLPGVPLIDGSVSPNVAAIPIKGARPGYIFREGQFFNVVPQTGDAAGIHFLHSCSAETVVDGSGNASVPVHELLRIDLAADDVVRMDPVIEGELEAGEGQNWSSDRAEIVRPEFQVTEFAYGEWF